MEKLDGTVETLNVWTMTIVEAMSALWIKLAEFVPNLLAFLVILIVGYGISKMISALTRRALRAVKLDAFSERIGVSAVLRRANVQKESSLILSSIVFWLIMLTFLVSATESLGLSRVSATIDVFVLYLPKVLGAAFIMMVGLFIAQFVRDLIVSGAEGIGSDFAGPLGSAAYGLMVVIVVILAVGQLELETELLSVVISIALLSFGAAAAIGFGFGSRDIASNLLAGNYLRDMLREGDRISVAGQTGVVHQVSAVKTEIKLDDGNVLSVSNRKIVDSDVVRLLS